jgi:hypothetical protein
MNVYRVEDIFSAENGFRAIGGLSTACLSGNRKTFDSISIIQKELDNAAGFLPPEHPSSYVHNLAGDTFSAEVILRLADRLKGLSWPENRAKSNAYIHVE